ncbi:glycogen phosphorylase [Pontibacillus halophilus JSM 076056 = DSM 19796]|uniref:Alpha-1,4 glucan phosphorylase n=1 Tax=Pontibacillus halophilus JSM 076056 = DSM 19796 TaxID=1385510 RepID=A0A0A5GI85_9BACI|nr:glycogen/starch/alpha-glucan phosphorylase [Pontibacillus halophilus]KGX92951.1 glycogen phosphorylase [Pontibacillus halophilus JSM 076056 = DSM 19796]
MFKNKHRFKEMFVSRLETMHGKSVEEATLTDCYATLGSMVREQLSKDWIRTNDFYRDEPTKQVYYLSMEFLLGKLLKTNLVNLGIRDLCEKGLGDLGIDLEAVELQEPDAGLGNGGLGRLAADFMDSLASLQLPGHGCGIRYKYGLFEQKIVDGYQVEVPDYWLREGNVWEVRKSDKAVEVPFYGEVISVTEGDRIRYEHVNYEPVLAVPYDIPMVGYENRTVNSLRLWSAESAIKDFDFNQLHHKNYHRIIEYKRNTEAISEFLYPDDSTIEGKMLRLKQQYFMVSASLQSILCRFKRKNIPITDLPNEVAIHTNDTHPVLAIPELMRLLMDKEGLGWDEAWDVTTRTISYTNHTIMVEALEKWPIDLMQPLLPRIYMIINEINERFCQQLWDRHPGEWALIERMAIISHGYVNMAHLAVVGSYSVNGVSKLHSNILKNELLSLFYKEEPYKFNNKTNGITHRRWLLTANPLLSKTITEAIGPAWIESPEELERLAKYADDVSLQNEFAQVKQKNKNMLAKKIWNDYGIKVDPASIFDVHIKRMHAYKRQLLNVFHILDLYRVLKDNPNLSIVPRTFLFGGKAAPSYHLAKSVVKLIHTVAQTINSDTTIRDQLKVVFIPNYGVTHSEQIVPAADVSEQISTASKEASGTGNMKFMMNGALTIGTYDGANIEMAEAVGEENMFLFGLRPDEVIHYYEHGGYHAREMYNQDPRLKHILDQLVNGTFVKEDVDFKSIYYSLIDYDEFFVLKDFASYVDAQHEVTRQFHHRSEWVRKCILNVAHSGVFSSDRTIQQYAKDVWRLTPVAKLNHK